EVEVVKEEKENQKAEDEYDPISDTEEDHSVTISQPAEPVNQHVLGKRLRAKATTERSSYIQEESSTQRRLSGRLPKRSRRDEDFVYGTP
ncbi:hypothetical protein BDW66DRAFT_129145, partial [Aspergillus desertorum]